MIYLVIFILTIYYYKNIINFFVKYNLFISKQLLCDKHYEFHCYKCYK